MLNLVEMYRRIRRTCNMYADDDKGTISSHNLPMKAQRWSRGIVVE
jgi:hypothetical protein